MPTYVIYDRRYYDSDILIFGVFNYDTIPEVYVEKPKEDGMFLVHPPERSVIQEYVKFIEGIFHPDSNFVSAVCERFGIPEENFKGVKFYFNRIEFTITKENASADKMFKYWQEQSKKSYLWR